MISDFVAGISIFDNRSLMRPAGYVGPYQDYGTSLYSGTRRQDFFALPGGSTRQPAFRFFVTHLRLLIRLITATNNAEPIIDQMIGKLSPPILTKKR